MSHTSRWQQSVQGVLIVVVLLIFAAFAPLFSTLAAQEALTATVKVTTTTVNPKTGEVKVQGTIRCSEAAEGDVSVFLRQSIGRYGKVIEGSGSTSVTCNESRSSRFTLKLFAINGRFKPGQAVMQQFNSFCPISPYPYPYPGSECTSSSQTQSVKLRSGK